MAAGDLSDFRRVMRATARNHARQGQLPFVTEPQLPLGIPEVPGRVTTGPYTNALQQHLFDPAGFNPPGPLVTQPTLPFEGAPIRPMASVSAPNSPFTRVGSSPNFAAPAPPTGPSAGPTAAPTYTPPPTGMPNTSIPPPPPTGPPDTSIPPPSTAVPAAAAGAEAEGASGFASLLGKGKSYAKGAPGRAFGGFALSTLGNMIANNTPAPISNYARVGGDVGGLGFALGGPVGAGAALPAALGVEALTSTTPGNQLINTLRSAPEDHPWWAEAVSMLPPLLPFKGITALANKLTEDSPEGPVFQHSDDKLSDVVGRFTGQGQPQPGQAPAPKTTREATPRNADTLTEYMNKVQLHPEMQAKVTDQYNTMRETLVRTGMKVRDEKDPTKQRDATDDEINTYAWDQAVGLVPMLKGQQGQEEDFIRRTTSMQAALSQQVPGLLTAGNYSPQQLSREQASLNMIPAFLSMGEYADRNRALASQIQQYKDAQMMAAMGLTGQGQGQSQGLDAQAQQIDQQQAQK